MRAGWITLAALTLASRAAGAQDSPEDQARQSFQRGVAAMQQRRYPTAIAELEFSYGLLPRCSTLFNLAVAFEQTHRYASSYDAFTRYQSDCGDTMTAQNTTYLTSALPRLRAHIAVVTLRVTPASAVASLTVDRRLRTTTLTEFALDPGSHTIEVRARDGRNERRDLLVVAGDRQSFDFNFGSTAPVPALPLAADPYGADEAPPVVRRTPHARVETPVDSAAVADDVLARPSDIRRTPHESASSPVYTRWWFWTLIGAAAVAGAVTITYELTRPTDDVVYTFQAVQSR